MLNYKPSIGQENGNDTPVSVRQDGTLYGASIGGKIVPKLNLPLFPQNPVNTDLSDTSTWFYKPFTDYNFINGQEYYRVLYIGADPDSSENELIGKINASINNTFSSDDLEKTEIVDNSISVQIWSEGKFNFASSHINDGGLLLEDEFDSTGAIESVAVWTDSIEINKTLIPGEYYKIWVKVSSAQDERLLEYDGFTYNITVGRLTIPVIKETGRLNISSVYSVDLNDFSKIDYVLTETLPRDFDLNEIVKVIEKESYTNVFYFDDCRDLNVLTIRKELNLNQNKYINTNLKELTGDIKESQDFTYTNFSQCISLATTGVSAVPDIDTDCVTGSSTSGTSASPIIDVIDQLLDSKFIVDIFASKKEDLNIFFILYNEFITNSDDEYVTKYGHKDYNWKTGVIKVDLRNINEVYFKNIDYDETFQMTLFDESSVFEMQTDHYWTSVVLIDDLFIVAGFDVEDCRLRNNRSFLTHIWEKDLILNDINYQKTLIPESTRNTFQTVTNKANTEAYLDFSNIGEVDTLNTFVPRETMIFANGLHYVKMGPPHRNAVNHRYSSITYDLSLKEQEFSITWAFGLDADQTFNATPAITGTGTSGTSGTGTSGTSGTGTSGTSGTGTSGTSGTGTSGTSGTGTSGTSGIIDDDFKLVTSPYFIHMLYQKDYDDYINDPYALVNPFSSEFKDTYISIFKIHCNGNTENPALTVEYNFYDNIWKIITEDKDAKWVRNFVGNGPRISLDFENVITVNCWRKQVYGCNKKYMVNFNVYVDGISLFDGISYTDSTTDSYVLTHNHDEEFSGHISYLETKKGLLEEGQNYATTMFQILSNIAWAEKETEYENNFSPKGLEFFSYKTNFILNNLNWNNKDDFIFPLVLQGNSYNLGSDYNKQITRTTFDFSKINVNSPSFAFTLEGSSETIPWESEKYDFSNDIMVIWLKLSNWKGQRITMYYGDIRIINNDNINRVYKDYFGLWHMNDFHFEPQVRFTNNKVYDGGEPIILAENRNGAFTLQVDKQYFFGNSNIYKSNKFDILYNDIEVHRNREEYVNDFIKNSVNLFKPATMHLREIKSLYPLKIESDCTGNQE